MDVSDGLADATRQIAGGQRVRHGTGTPTPFRFIPARKRRACPLWLWSGGEDYRLRSSAYPGNAPAVPAAVHQASETHVTEIGVCTKVPRRNGARAIAGGTRSPLPTGLRALRNTAPMSLRLSRSLRMKLLATAIAAVAFVVIYENVMMDSRTARIESASETAAPLAGHFSTIQRHRVLRGRGDGVGGEGARWDRGSRPAAVASGLGHPHRGRSHEVRRHLHGARYGARSAGPRDRHLPVELLRGPRLRPPQGRHHRPPARLGSKRVFSAST